jgi:hypothetical protein
MRFDFSGWKGVCLMKRAILILLLASGLAGCKTQTPTVDPFFGRTTIPPPATGSIAGQSADPYYRQTSPTGSPSLQANVPYNYNPGGIPTNPTNPPASYAGAGSYRTTNPATNPPGTSWTNPSYAPQYPGPAQSTLAGPSTTTAPGISTNNLGRTPQNNSTYNSPPAGYTPQQPSAQPASMPSNTPGTNLPGGNRYAPPGGNFNYRGTYNEPSNSRPTPASPNRVAAPFFAGGAPNRSSIPITDANPGPVNYAPGTAAAATNANSYQNAANPQGNQYMYPASRQYIQPTPAQPPSNAAQPSWRESSSSDSRLTDDNVQAASGTETIQAEE